MYPVWLAQSTRVEEGEGVIYQDLHATLYNQDFRTNELPDESVQCAVTSPPYWGLRKYSGEQDLVWGDTDCDHEWLEETVKATGGLTEKQMTNSGSYFTATRGQCSLCGAWKGAYGLEPTPELYVQHTIEILREIRRVLRKDGVVFLNLGDSYYSSPGGDRHGISAKVGQADYPTGVLATGRLLNHNILKPKDLCLVPFRVAIAAQEDGWWVRSIIIWSKPNPTPESVQDRPTESHEYILMLTKSGKYYWDADAVRESINPNNTGKVAVRPSGDSLTRDKEHWGVPHEREMVIREYEELKGRNIRTVWEFPTHPYPEAHFAVFPEKLPEICIKAASKPDDIVLDPFAGAGTTLWVAKKLNRKAVGYELSEEYCRLTEERLRQQVMI